MKAAAARRRAVGGDEGMDIADDLLGLRTFSRDEGEQVLVRHAGAIQLHWRDLDAFLVDLARAQLVLGAADIADMADGADQRHHARRRGTPA